MRKKKGKAGELTAKASDSVTHLVSGKILTQIIKQTIYKPLKLHKGSSHPIHQEQVCFSL